MKDAGVALTVDVEEWFHICGVGGALDRAHWAILESRVVANTHVLLDMLDSAQAHATFFVLGCVAERYPSLVARIRDAGHDIGSHGHWHDRAYDLTPEAFAEDLDRSLAALAACGVTTIAGYRAPEWSINDKSLWALDTLAARGIRVDSSMAPLKIVGRPDYPQAIHRRTTSHGEIVECPPAVTRRFGQMTPFGGGWGLRLQRPAAALRAIERRRRAGQPTVIWTHPWEIDDDPPRISLPRGKAFAHYFRLDGFRARFESIVRGASVVPLQRLVEDAGLA